ncbi:hypothetical protein L596_008668 [Steinernema carpocapsae]|uniref:Uncharacterized protein n=1 Tax=Steinernema carpocapsae TaxID=34508 RepID=A0A4U5PD67_STECR|nr:hypothetical protein L596_008668 [Steinernema carpocapsae]
MTMFLLTGDNGVINGENLLNDFGLTLIAAAITFTAADSPKPSMLSESVCVRIPDTVLHPRALETTNGDG